MVRPNDNNQDTNNKFNLELEDGSYVYIQKILKDSVFASPEFSNVKVKPVVYAREVDPSTNKLQEEEQESKPDIEGIFETLKGLRKSAGMSYEDFLRAIDSGEVKNFSRALIEMWGDLEEEYKELTSK